MHLPPSTPILVGVGQFAESLESPDYRACSPVELAAEAARRACEDALSVAALAPRIDLVAGIRQFEISVPMAPAPLGRSNNFPRSVARRLGADPRRAVLEITGGQGPQHLVNEVCAAIAAGEAGMALLVGAEAISTVRHFTGRADRPNWAETVDGSLEDRGYGLEGVVTPEQLSHQLLAPPPVYALFEHARRARLGLSREDYARQMGTLFAPFTAVAAANPYAAAPERHAPEALVTLSSRNRMIADPYPRLLVARDQVNQGAAVLLTSVGTARALGIAESKWVFLHGHADLRERSLLERADLGRSPAAVAACHLALEAAGVAMDALRHLDLYSCFPIAVSNLADAFGLAADDPRGLTVTGGLPYFGGAGNNYSMHAIASIVERLRAAPGTFGLVAANGGFLSKHSVGVYSTIPTPWRAVDNAAAQAALDAAPAVAAACGDGPARIETYTVLHERGEPKTGIVVARREDGARCLALSDADPATLPRMVEQDPLGAAIRIAAGRMSNRFSFG